MECPTGKSISIRDAAFGRGDAITCPKTGAMSNQNCKASKSAQEARNM